MRVRKWVLRFHKFFGLLAALPLILLGLSGAIVAFEPEIDHALNRAYWDVQPQATKVSWTDVIDSARKLYPKDAVASLRFPPAPDMAAAVGLKSGVSVAVDPYTGKPQGTHGRGWSFTTYVHQFHTHLLMGQWGSRIVGVASLLMIVLSITGIILWWRRKQWRIQWTGSWRKANFELHETLGIVALLPWLILSFTGAVIGYEGFVRPMLYRITNSQPNVMPTLKSAPAPGAKPVNVDAIVAQAEAILPGAETVIVFIPTSPGGTFTAFMRFPEDRTPGGRSRVVLDQFSAKPLWIENSRTTAAGTQIFNKNRPIHTGDIFGWPTRILASAASLFLAVQVVSGVWIWGARKFSR